MPTQGAQVSMDTSPMSKDRLEAYSDGVFALALTLLILDLRVPSVVSHSSLGQYAAAMVPLVPKVLCFALTFVMICIHWVGHHYFFVRLRHVTLSLVWINNLFLLWICIMPFPMSMLGDHPTDQFPILLYALNQLVAALTFFVFRAYASRHKLFIDASAVKVMGPRHSIPAIVMYTLAALFVFVNVYVSLVCLFLIPLLYFIPTLISL
jgi:uncharacterized membrane protein